MLAQACLIRQVPWPPSNQVYTLSATDKNDAVGALYKIHILPWHIRYMHVTISFKKKLVLYSNTKIYDTLI